MATIIDNAYFIDELELPVDNIDVQSFINKHEPDILDKVLGVELADEFKAALDGTPATKWEELRDGKVYTDFAGNKQRYKGIFLIIANYVYFKTTKKKQTIATDSGIKSQITENAEKTSPRKDQVFAWNDMVDRIVFLDEFINVTNSDTPDTYDNYLPTTQKKGNVFNI